MHINAAAVIVGVGIGVTAPIIKKAARPLGFYALAGGMLAYEAACEAIEFSRYRLNHSIKIKNIAALRKRTAKDESGEQSRP